MNETLERFLIEIGTQVDPDYYQQIQQAANGLERFLQLFGKFGGDPKTSTAAIEAFTTAVRAGMQPIEALQAIMARLPAIFQEGSKDALAFAQVQNTLARQTQEAAQQAQQATGGWRAWMEQLRQLNRQDTRQALLGLFREVERGIPLIGLLINPTATFLRQLTEIVRTGGPAGAVIRTLTDHLRGFLASLVRIGENALGFVIGNILLAPFNALFGAVRNVVGSIDNFLQRGLQLNQQLGKTNEEIREQNLLFDKLAVLVTRPAYEVLTNTLDRLTRAFSGGRDLETTIQSFASVVGTGLGEATQYFVTFIENVLAGGGPLDPQKFVEAGANLVAGFAEGLIQGFLSLVPLVASLIEGIAGFFIGQSPPPLGALRNIITGGKGIIDEWLAGMLQADFSVLDQLSSLVESRLNLGVANKNIKQADVPGLIASARDQIAQVMAEITTSGAVAEATLNRLRGLFGDQFSTVQLVIGAMIEWRNATLAVEAAQEAVNAATAGLRAIQADVQSILQAAQDHVRAIQDAAQAAIDVAQEAYEQAQKNVQAIQDKITAFENQTAEIPERFTRGRRRELDAELLAAQKRAQLAADHVRDVQKAQQAQVKAAQDELEAIRKAQQARVEAAQKEVEAAQRRLQDAQKEAQLKQQQLALAERLLAEDAKRNALLAQQARDNEKFTLKFKLDPNLVKEFEEKFLDPIRRIFKEKLSDDFKQLQDFFRTLLTGERIFDGEKDDGRPALSKGSAAALALREAIQKIDQAWKAIAPELLAFIKALLGGEKTFDASGVETQASRVGSSIRGLIQDVGGAWNGLPPDLKTVLLVLLGVQAATGIPGILGAAAAVGALGLALRGVVGLLGAGGGLLARLLGGGAAGVAGDALGAAGLNKGLPLGEFIEKGITGTNWLKLGGAILSGIGIAVGFAFDNLGTLASVGSFVQKFLGDLLPEGTIQGEVARILGGLFEIAGGVLVTIGGIFNLAFTAIFTGLQTVVLLIKGLITGDFSDLRQALLDRFEEAKTNFAIVLTGIQLIVQGFVDGVIGHFVRLWQVLFGASIIPDIQRGFENFLLFLTGLSDSILTLFAGMVNGVTTTLGVLQTNISTVITNVQTMWSTFWDGLVRYATTSATNIAGQVQSALNNLANLLGLGGGGGTNTTEGTRDTSSVTDVTNRLERASVRRPLAERFGIESSLARTAREFARRQGGDRSEREPRGGEGITIVQNFPESIPLWERDDFKKAARDAAHDAFVQVMKPKRA